MHCLLALAALAPDTLRQANTSGTTPAHIAAKSNCERTLHFLACIGDSNRWLDINETGMGVYTHTLDTCTHPPHTPTPTTLSRAHTHALIHSHTQTFTHTRTLAYSNIHTLKHSRTHTFTHSNIHTHTRTLAHPHTRTPAHLPTFVDRSGSAAAHYAARLGNRDAYVKLCEMSACMCNPDRNGDTPTQLMLNRSCASLATDEVKRVVCGKLPAIKQRV
jgi:ankyrin repeat protein